MAVIDFTEFLGKRVSFKLDWSLVDERLKEISIVTGVVVAFLKYADGYEPEDGTTDILFLEDGYDEPDFISSCHDFKIIV